MLGGRVQHGETLLAHIPAALQHEPCLMISRLAVDMEPS